LSSLDQVLGTILASLAHARRIADQETIAIAEYYRSEPLLAGMSLPRIRVPEMVVDLPFIIEEESPPKPEVHEDVDVIIKAISARLVTAVREENGTLPRGAKQRFERQLTGVFRETRIGKEGFSRKDVVKAVGRAFTAAREEFLGDLLDERQLRAISKAILNEAAAIAVKEERTQAIVKVSVRTVDIKEKSDSHSVVRIKLVLREEGVEWTSTEDDDGTLHRFLTPE